MNGNTWLHRSAAMATLMMLACGGLPDLPWKSSSSSSSGAPTSPTQEYYFTVCDTQERCAAVGGNEYTSAAACKREWAHADGFYRALFGVGVFEQVDQQYAAPDIQRCTAALSNQDCAEPKPPSECNLDPTHPAALQGACGNSYITPSAVCGKGLYCEVKDGHDSCGECQSVKGSGQPCSSNDECTSEYCNSGACQDPVDKALGASCTNANDKCHGSLLCLDGICANRRNAGDTCNATHPCYGDLRCDSNGVCAPYIQIGEACPWSSANTCRGWCKPVDASHHVCESWDTLPAQVGATCGGFGDTLSLMCRREVSPGHSSSCTEAGGTPTCVALMSNGGDCRASGNCVSFRCVRAAGATTGTCGAKLPNGQGTCNSDLNCESNFCLNSTCQPKPDYCF